MTLIERTFRLFLDSPKSENKVKNRSAMPKVAAWVTYLFKTQ
jgi:hypothetical protein